MDEYPIPITAKEENDKENQNISSITDLSISSIFENYNCSNYYLEIFNKEKNKINIVFRRPETVNSNKEIKIEKIKELKEIKLIFDFQCLSNELSFEKVNKLIYDFYELVKNDNKIKLSLVIENSLVNNFDNLDISNNKLKLNELVISDELYMMSPNLNILFPQIEVNKLVLKKIKINSRLQLENFCNFIINSECKELILEDIFIELIIKKDENDTEYNDLDGYFTYSGGVITLNHQYTKIRSLTLRDCPLFAISKDMFNLNTEIEQRYIDIDETSLINPSIITKFKIDGKKFDICFDLDSYKLIKEEEENDDNNDKKENEDYLDYLTYIFDIFIGFSDDDNNINNKKEEEDEESEEEDYDNLGKISREYFYKITFKNFDTTKYEYTTGDQVTLIKEENWILNDDEKKRKKKWEIYEQKLKEFKFEKLSNVKSLIFENCTNFFIQWIINFTQGNENKSIRKSYDDDYELLKFKKCGKDYIDLKYILTMKINNLILFDTPLIIDHFNDEKKPHLDYLNNQFGSVENLTIKINTLDYYNKEYNLNTYKTMEILVELMQCIKFNKNLSFDMNALEMIMTFLIYKEYNKKIYIYSDPNIEESGKDIMSEEIINKINNDNLISNNSEKLTHVTKKIFFSTKIYRDYLINKSFELSSLENSKITIINAMIKKQSENYENQNYLISKKQGKKNIPNNELKKLEKGNNYINIDKDYKQFFSINKISTVTLKNVEFSHFMNNLIKDLEKETIINLVSFTDEEKKIISDNAFHPPLIPNYRMDMKTLNGILFKNYLFEDIGSMFRYFVLKIEQNAGNDMADKKATLSDYFFNYKKIFISFKENIKELTFIINNVFELKELFCILSVFKVILVAKNWIKESLVINNHRKVVLLPNKKIIEKEIGCYFLQDKNEEKNDIYSEFNYYFTSPGEENMFKDKKIMIDNYLYYIDCQFNDYI